MNAYEGQQKLRQTVKEKVIIANLPIEIVRVS